MISCTEFIPAYSELFTYLDKKYGREEVNHLWDFLFAPTGKGIPLNNHLGHFTLGGLTQEFTVRHARLGRMLRLAKQVEHNDHSQGDDPPEHEIPRKLIQKLPPYGPAAPNPAKPRAQCKFSLSV
mgnify:CR=1 FL=1